MFVDTHAHFDADAGPDALCRMLERAHAAGVDRVVAIGGSLELDAGALAAARCDPDRVQVTLGLDRDHAKTGQDLAAAMATLRCDIDCAREEGIRVVGIGETGLDFHYRAEMAGPQVELLGVQLDLARDLVLPVVVHSREADDETAAALADHARQWTGAPDRLGVLHCFTGGQEFADRLLSLGYYISFSGIVTFRNAVSLRKVAKRVPADRLLLETDSPYLAPVPHRGKGNEPAYLPDVATVVAEVRGVPRERIEELTTRNAERLFGLN